jgi:hypothetical protein
VRAVTPNTISNSAGAVQPWSYPYALCGKCKSGASRLTSDLVRPDLNEAETETHVATGGRS